MIKVVAELYAGVRDDERENLDEFVSLFPVLPITPEIAKAGGLLKGLKSPYVKK